MMVCPPRVSSAATVSKSVGSVVEKKPWNLQVSNNASCPSCFLTDRGEWQVVAAEADGGAVAERVGGGVQGEGVGQPGRR